MNINDDLELDCERFVWRTKEGEILYLEDMETSHIFNAMKMQYNHLAEIYGLPTVWFMQRYDGCFRMAREVPKKVARVMLIFIYEILKRGDLPEKYTEPFKEIMFYLRRASGYADITLKQIGVERKGLPDE